MAPLTPVLVLVLAVLAAASTGSSLVPSHEDYAIVNFFRRVFGISSNDEVPVRVLLFALRALSSLLGIYLR